MTDKTNTNNESVQEAVHFAMDNVYSNQDLKHSILIVSLVANLVIFTTWIALQVTTQYDTQIASLLFSR